MDGTTVIYFGIVFQVLVKNIFKFHTFPKVNERKRPPRGLRKVFTIHKNVYLRSLGRVVTQIKRLKFLLNLFICRITLLSTVVKGTDLIISHKKPLQNKISKINSHVFLLKHTLQKCNKKNNVVYKHVLSFKIELLMVQNII